MDTIFRQIDNERAILTIAGGGASNVTVSSSGLGTADQDHTIALAGVALYTVSTNAASEAWALNWQNGVTKVKRSRPEVAAQVQRWAPELSPDEVSLLLRLPADEYDLLRCRLPLHSTPEVMLGNEYEARPDNCALVTSHETEDGLEVYSLLYWPPGATGGNLWLPFIPMEYPSGEDLIFTFFVSPFGRPVEAQTVACVPTRGSLFMPSMAGVATRTGTDNRVAWETRYRPALIATLMREDAFD